MDTIKIAVVDDHPVVLMGINMALKSLKARHISLCGNFDTGKELLDQFGEIQADIVLVDLILPDIFGDELIRQMIIINPTVKIGIFSSFMDRKMILNAFENGARGYLSKSAGTQEFIEYVETLANGGYYIKGKIAEILLPGKRQISFNNDVRLTEREREIARFITDGHKSKDIASRLFISERTVEFHRKNIYEKFGVNSAIDFVRKNLGQKIYELDEST